MSNKTRWYGLLCVILGLLLAACAPTAPAAEAPAAEAPAETEGEAAEAPAEEAAAPVASGRTWINVCEEEPVDGGEITLATGSTAMGAQTWLSYGSTNEPFVFSQLVDLSIEDAATFEPEVAESWEESDDGLVFTYHLRDDVLWHDGEPLTAEDVKWTIELFSHPDSGVTVRTVLPLSGIAGYTEFVEGTADEISGAEVIDDHTIQLTLSAPRADFFYGMAGMNLWPKHPFEGMDYIDINTSTLVREDVVGSGPFKMGEFVPDQYYILEANEDYFDGRPHLDRLIFRIGLNTVASWLPGLESGEIQAGSTVNGLDHERVMATEGLTVVGAPLPGAMAIWPNHRNFPDKRVLQALFHAIDREAITTGIYGPGQAFVYDFDNIDPNHTWISPNVPDYPYDPELAKQLLADAGWDASRELSFVTYYLTELDRNVVAAMQQYWADVGVKVNVEHMESPAWAARVYEEPDFDLGYGCCGISVPFEYSRYSCANVPPAGVNASAYCNEEIDQLVTDAISEADPEARKQMWYTISEITNDELLHLTLFQQDRGHAINANVCNYQFRQWSNITWPERSPETWFLKPGS
ncbi:MAG: ABC transporter substrate-binding protein [Caldilineaceae bacterium]|nr:ABC transporter substrate-binding protein [Caldilineaceae bacterium]